jgi:NAD(P)-dependent dehydrogenase (short-subunit alcohol dehydrogenase family)
VLGVSRTTPPEALTRRPSFRWARADVADVHDMDLLRYDIARLDAVVHCAGVRAGGGATWETDPGDWMRTVRTNLTGSYLVARLAVPFLAREEDGRLLLFSGGGAFGAAPGFSAYATSKGGVVSLMETLSEELLRDPTHANVAVNAVAPGFVPTSMHPGKPDEGGLEMARAVGLVLHLLSPATRGLTGKTVSAAWDDWELITPETAPDLSGSEMGSRTRPRIRLAVAS